MKIKPFRLGGLGNAIHRALGTACPRAPMTGHGVLVNGQPMSFDELYWTTEGQELLGTLRGCDKGRILCTCNKGQPLPLLVQLRSRRYFLKCYQDTKSKHDKDLCQRHGETAPPRARDFDSGGSVYELDGETHVNLTQSLSEEVLSPLGSPVPLEMLEVTKRSRNSTSGTRRENSCGIQVGLRALWTTAGLHGTVYERRPPENWRGVAQRFSDHFPAVWFSGERARDVVIVAGIERTIKHHRLHQRSRDGGKKYCLLVGEVSRLETQADEPSQGRLWFSACKTPVQVNNETWKNALRCCPFPNAEALVASIDLPRQMLTFVAMGRIERTDQGDLRFVDLRLMVVSRFYIPVESRLEAEMANEFVRTGRRFLKPLLFDAKIDIVLPDFVIYDTALPCVVEVFGVHGNADYDAGATRKRVLYKFNSDQIEFAEWLGTEAWPSIPKEKHAAWVSLPTGIRTGLHLRKLPEPIEG